MTLFDYAIVAVLLVSGILALLRGFTSELMSIVAWVAAALAALWLFPLLTPVVRGMVSPEWLAAVISALGIFIVVFVVVSAVTYRWSGWVHAIHEHAGLLDRTLGLVFGIARGLLIVSVAYLFFNWLVPDRRDQPDWIREARLLPLVESTATALFALAPVDEPPAIGPYLDEISPSSAPSNDPAPENSAADTENGKGYKPSERRGLDRLFESETGEP